MKGLFPYLVVKDGKKACEWYQKALDAKMTHEPAVHDGVMLHASLKIGESTIFLTEEIKDYKLKSPTTLKGTSCSFYLYVDDVDAAFKKAVDAGATITTKPENMFWGDRFSSITDPYGHEWQLARNLTDKEKAELEIAKK